MADTKISALVNGDPPQDADDFPVARSGANNKLSWLNLRTALASLFDAIGAASAAVAAHVAAGDPHTQYQLRSEKNAISGYAGLDAGSKLTGSQQVYGSAANTAAQGNDSRLSDARTPTAHASTHASAGSDPVNITGLSGYPGGTTQFLRADGTFAAPADPSYSPGTFTVVTETARAIFNHLNLTTTQRATIRGTGRLRLSN